MNAVLKLVDYAKETGLIEEEEQIWAVNTLLDALGLDALPALPVAENATLPEILDTLLDDAYARGVLKENTTTYRDLFDTELMGGSQTKVRSALPGEPEGRDRLVLQVQRRHELYPSRPLREGPPLDNRDSLRDA